MPAHFQSVRFIRDVPSAFAVCSSHDAARTHCCAVGRLNFDQSGALTLRQFHTWVASLNGKGGSRARSLERREMLKCFFVPVLMALNPTVKPWKLTAMEFVNMVRLLREPARNGELQLDSPCPTLVCGRRGRFMTCAVSPTRH